MANLTVSNETVPIFPKFHPGGFIDDTAYFYTELALRKILNPVTSLIAVFTGIVNIFIFAQMDMKQGVTQNLMVLSCSDFVLSLITTVGNFCYVVISLGYYVIGGVNILHILYACSFSVNYPMYISLVTTTVIAVVRCLSVVMPLSFRAIVTSRRQLAAIGVISAVALVIPVYTHVIFATSTAGSAGNAEIAMFDLFRNLFFYGCLSTIIVSMAFLMFALKKSSKFQALASGNAGDEKQAKASTVRDAQIIKTVIIILAIFVLTNVPLTLLAVLWRMIVGVSINLNVSLNFLAYYFNHTVFRKTVQTSFCKFSKSVKESG